MTWSAIILGLFFLLVAIAKRWTMPRLGSSVPPIPCTGLPAKRWSFFLAGIAISAGTAAKANRLEYDRLIAEWLANGRQQLISAIGMPKPWSRFALLMRRFLDNCWL